MNLLVSQVGAFTTPDVPWPVLLPLIFIFGGATVGVLIEAFAPRATRRAVNVAWSIIVVLATIIAVALQWNEAVAAPIITGQYVNDGFTVAFQMTILLVGLLSLLLMVDRTSLGDGSFAAQPADRPGSGEESLSLAKNYQRSEVYPLMLFSLGGMMVFPATNSLLTMFVALEVMSLPLYVLAATARRRRAQSHEAGLKYFLLGAFSSGFFLMGAALLYGYSGGSLQLAQISAGIPVFNNMEWILLVGVFLVLAGLLFKVAAVPFHAWTPDVYTGAPTPITGFMAAGVKVAAFGAMLRFYQVVAGTLQWDFRMLLAVIAAATIVVGTAAGLWQTNIKRLLAYSAIAHAGFLLIGVLSLAPGSAASVAFYLLSYGIATVGAFGVVTLVRSAGTDGSIGAEASNLVAWRGLGKRSPLLAGAMLVFLLSFAGIPLTSGFIAKFVVFADGIAGGLGWLVGIALAASAVTAVFYFRVVATMFLREPGERTAVVDSEGYSTAVIGLAAAATILLGVVPGPVIGLLEKIVIVLS